MLTAPNCVTSTQIRNPKINFMHCNFNYLEKNPSTLFGTMETQPEKLILSQDDTKFREVLKDIFKTFFKMLWPGGL